MGRIMGWFHRKTKTIKIGDTVKFDGKLWVISAESSYYDNDINLLLVPVKAKGVRGPLSD